MAIAVQSLVIITLIGYCEITESGLPSARMCSRRTRALTRFRAVVAAGCLYTCSSPGSLRQAMGSGDHLAMFESYRDGIQSIRAFTM